MLLVSGFFQVAVGIIGMIIMTTQGIGSKSFNNQLIFGKYDSFYFDKSPQELLHEYPKSKKLFNTYWIFILGYMIAFGVACSAMTWFGVRHNLEWAFWATALSNVVFLIAHWGLAVIPAMRDFGTSNYFAIWYPFWGFYQTVAVPVAMLLWWMGRE